MKFSDLSNKPLLSLAEGSVVGHVKSCLLNSDKTKLLALSSEDGWIAAPDARVGEGAVTVRSISVIENEIPRSAAASPLYQDLFCSDGSLVGEIGDLVFDEKFNLTAFVVGAVEYPRSLMLSSGENAVVVCADEEQLKSERRKIAAARKKTEIERPICSDVGSVASADFSYLIGRRVVCDIFNQRNEKIVRKNSVVSLHTLQVCREYRRLLSLAKNSKIPTK